jgi:D-alanine-D-alanine ligase
MPVSIGLVYDLLGTYPRRPHDPADVDVEYEPEATVQLLEAAIARLGNRSVRLGSPHDLLGRLAKSELPKLDAALTIAEGWGGREREAWAPVLLAMSGIPTLGSDATTLSVALDKHWAHTLVAAAGVPVAPQVVFDSAAQARGAALPAAFPVFVKPRWEGTSKGIAPSSRVESRQELVAEVEYTVTVVGNDPPRALPALQRALEATTRIGLHALEKHPAPAGGWRHCLPGSLDPGLERELGALALRAFAALDCRDFARADFRLDQTGRPVFLEINPLPTFAPDGSFGILAELEGRPAEALVADVLAGGLRRLGLA